MVAVGGVGALGGAPFAPRWRLVAIVAQSQLRNDRLSGSDLQVRRRLLFLRGSDRGCVARGGGIIGVDSCGWPVSPPLTERIETAPESLEQSRRTLGRRVPPVESKRLLVVLGRRPISRGGSVGAAGDVAGQPLGLIPLISGRGT